MTTSNRDRPGDTHTNHLHQHPPIKLLAERQTGNESLYALMVRLANEHQNSAEAQLQAGTNGTRTLSFSLEAARRTIPQEHSTKSVQFTEITRFVDGALKNQDPNDRIENGIAVVSVVSPKSSRKRTSALTFMEFEDGTAQDLNNALERLVHTHNNGNGRGVEYLKAELFKPFIALPFQEVTMTPGTWGRLVHMGCDRETCTDDQIKIELLPAKINMFEIRDKKDLNKKGLWAIDITDRIEDAIRKSSNQNEGDLLLFTPHTTGGIVPINGSGITQFKRLLREFAPEGMNYWHDYTVGDGNGISHLQAVFLGPHYSVHYKNGVPKLDDHRVYYVDCDVAPARPRKVVVAEYQAPENIASLLREN